MPQIGIAEAAAKHTLRLEQTRDEDLLRGRPAGGTMRGDEFVLPSVHDRIQNCSIAPATPQPTVTTPALSNTTRTSARASRREN